MRDHAADALEQIAALMYPRRCAACRSLLLQDERDVCAPCRETLLPLGKYRRNHKNKNNTIHIIHNLHRDAPCPVCARPETGGQICPNCLQCPPAFAHTYAAFAYGAAIARIIQRLKYEDDAAAARALAHLTAETGESGEALSWCEALIPMPLHPRRLAKRGMNQAALIAQAMVQIRPHAPASSIMILYGALRRIRHTRPQVGQNFEARRINVQGIFAVNPKYIQHIREKRILVVDDVLTTGATASEAAQTLLSAGAREVRVFCAARAVSGMLG